MATHTSPPCIPLSDVTDQIEKELAAAADGGTAAATENVFLKEEIERLHGIVESIRKSVDKFCRSKPTKMFQGSDREAATADDGGKAAATTNFFLKEEIKRLNGIIEGVQKCVPSPANRGGGTAAPAAEAAAPVPAKEESESEDDVDECPFD